MMQGTADVPHQSAGVHLPEAAAVFDAATALDTARDMVDPQPTLVSLLVSHVLLPREFLPQIGINSNIYHFTKADYDHRTVNHGAGEYARRDPDGACVHWNTMEGMWSGLRNFLDRFQGIRQRFLHLRVIRYEFLHNHEHLNWF